MKSFLAVCLFLSAIIAIAIPVTVRAQIAGSWVATEHCSYDAAAFVGSQIANATEVYACQFGLCVRPVEYAKTVHIVPTKDQPTRWLVLRKAGSPSSNPPSLTLYVSDANSFDGSATYTDVGVTMNAHNRGSVRDEVTGEEVVWTFTDGGQRSVCP